jgi:hypothetical protein
MLIGFSVEGGSVVAGIAVVGASVVIMGFGGEGAAVLLGLSVTGGLVGTAVVGASVEPGEELVEEPPQLIVQI